MALELHLDNVDRLPDGGPVAVPLDAGRDIQVGRGAAMDWQLPDPTRHLSSHHFDVSFRDGAHWLIDVSTNGTFLLGRPYRLDEPHRLQPGDRFQAGPYILACRQVAAVPAPDAPGGDGLRDAWPVDDDPWAVGAPPPRVPAPPVPGPVPPPIPAPWPAPDDDPGVDPELPPLSALPRPDPSLVLRPPPAEAPPRAAPAPDPAPRPPADPDAVVAAFCEGAGLDPGEYGDVDALALAREVGAALRGTVA
uniref:type VI secretion system-associated FHA domain protein n=1 Tax=Jannaschia maritima TaxID=3032585 RepID=UPI002810A10C